MKAQSLDTPLEVENIHFEILRKSTVADRLAMANSLTLITLAMAQNTIRNRFPDISEEELAVRYVAWIYGEDLAARRRDFYCSEK